MSKFKEFGEKVEAKVLSSKWTPRVLGAVTTIGAFGGVIASADDPATTNVTTIDSSEVVQQLQTAAINGITNGYKGAVPVMAVALGIGLIVRKIMGAARHC